MFRAGQPSQPDLAHSEPPAARCMRVLDHGHGMQVDDARTQLAIYFGRGRIVYILPLSFGRVIKGPMLDFTLVTLPDDTMSAAPAYDILRRIGL
jgi:hypothetical protein